MSSVDSFSSKGTLEVGDASYEIFRLAAVPGVARLPYSLKILAENLLRTEDGLNTTADHVRAIAAWDPDAQPDTEIQFTPARVIMQDFTGAACRPALCNGRARPILILTAGMWLLAKRTEATGTPGGFEDAQHRVPVA